MIFAVVAALILQEGSSLLDQGRRFLAEGNLKAAETLFRELASRSPEDSRASYYLGITLARQDRTEEAVEALENARRHATGPNPSLFYELGTAYSRIERWQEAEDLLRQATDLAPAEAAMRLQLGWVYYSKLEGEKARAEFERVIATSPSAKAFLYLGMTEIGLGRNEPAVRALRQAIRLDAGLLDAHLALGKVLTRAGRDEEAIPVLARALEIDERSAEAHFGLGLIAVRRGDLESASRSFEVAIEAEPGHLQAWYNRALVAERLGHGEEARICWARVEEIRASGAEEPDARRRMRARDR
ncbi:MAG TPA: tetratricopeptide repeat protein [Vicinamibacteria bacterium]|nr:tetratricopeptide repeat protein [Vicinamibacteria bacterium]